MPQPICWRRSRSGGIGIEQQYQDLLADYRRRHGHEPAGADPARPLPAGHAERPAGQAARPLAAADARHLADRSRPAPRHRRRRRHGRGSRRCTEPSQVEDADVDALADQVLAALSDVAGDVERPPSPSRSAPPVPQRRHGGPGRLVEAVVAASDRSGPVGPDHDPAARSGAGRAAPGGRGVGVRRARLHPLHHHRDPGRRDPDRRRRPATAPVDVSTPHRVQAVLDQSRQRGRALNDGPAGLGAGVLLLRPGRAARARAGRDREDDRDAASSPTPGGRPGEPWSRWRRRRRPPPSSARSSAPRPTRWRSSTTTNPPSRRAR